jgi:LytR cell envelope-related transcriptional attenuator
LSSPTATVHAGARTYDLFYDGEHIKTIAWHEGEAVYWIENTLTNGVSPHDMVALAQETLPVTDRTANATTGGLHAPVGNLVLPNHSSVSSASLTEKSGAGVAIFVVITLAGLSILLLRRQRELGHLREQVAHALTLEAGQRYALAARIAPRRRTPVAEPRVPAVAQTATAGTDQTTGIPHLPLSFPHHGGQRTRYRAPIRRGVLALVCALAVAIAIAIGLGVYLLRSQAAAHTPSSGSSMPVAIFNATGSPGAAHRIAATLKANHEAVADVGDINASLGHGLFVLYPSNARGQAVRLARSLSSLRPTVTPIPPQVQSVIGNRREIVVVIG